MKSQRNALGGQTARKEKSVDNTIRELLECGDLAAGQAAIARLAQRQKDAPSKTALRVALDGAAWRTPALLPALVDALLPHTDPNVAFGKGRTALMLSAERCATFRGNRPDDAEIETLRLLVAVSDGRATDARGQSALMLAAKGLAPNAVIEALLPISNPLARDSAGRNALFLATEQRGSLDAVRLLAPHSDANVTGPEGKTPLMAAAQLLKEGWLMHGDVFAVLAPLTTARLTLVLQTLREAASPPRPVGLHRLVAAMDAVTSNPAFSLRGAKNNLARFPDGDFPKTVARIAEAERAAALAKATKAAAAPARASREKSIDATIRELFDCESLAEGERAIERIARRQEETPSETALRSAIRKAEWKTPALLPLLVSALAPHTDVNARFAGGKTVLMLAVERCDAPKATPTHAALLEAVRLLAAVCDGRATDDHKKTALMCATKMRVDPSVIESLLPFSDPNAQDSSGRTALHLAALKHSSGEGTHRAAFKLLLPVTTTKIANVLALFEAGFKGDCARAQALDEVLCSPGLSLRRVRIAVARNKDVDLPKARMRVAAAEAGHIAEAFDEARRHAEAGRLIVPADEMESTAPAPAAPRRDPRRL